MGSGRWGAGSFDGAPAAGLRGAGLQHGFGAADRHGHVFAFADEIEAGRRRESQSMQIRSPKWTCSVARRLAIG